MLWDKGPYRYGSVRQRAKRLENSVPNHIPKNTLKRWPIPKVIVAAASPKTICLRAVGRTGRPVNRVITAPMAKSIAELAITLRATAAVPEKRTNGMTGTIAPIVKSEKDVTAACHADPPSDSGSIPNSSRASVSSALD